jgi:ribosomal protein S18 acetylase RimI-like enzyme
MLVRGASVGDAETLAALNRFVHDTHLVRRPDYFTPSHVEEVSAWFRKQLDHVSTAAWIAQEGDVAVGYLLMFVRERAQNAFRRARRWCEIDQIAVDPAWRRRGIGTALMTAALEEASARGVRDVELSSWAFNSDAHAMFQRVGFEPRLLTFERRAR